MNKNLYLVCVGAFSLSMLGCSDDGISGSSEDPNVLTALGSSSSVLGVSSSSVPGTSSSAIPGVSSSSVAQSSSGGADFNSGDLWNPSAGDFSVNVADSFQLFSIEYSFSSIEALIILIFDFPKLKYGCHPSVPSLTFAFQVSVISAVPSLSILISISSFLTCDSSPVVSVTIYILLVFSADFSNV